jgi:hypothetical protein
MSSNHVEYYRRRAITERELALKSDGRIAEIHEELARGYQALVDEAELRPKLRIVTPERQWA